MRRALVVAILASAWATPWPAGSAFPDPKPSTPPREARVRVGKADLYSREIGQGQPVIVLHGGPDFDHRYLLPEMDRLADSLRLIYYDQRGRGRSGDGVRPEDVTLESEMGDLDTVRRHFGLGSVAILGHSWGTVLALEYAIRHPDRVSHLILMNPAPASHDDFMLYRKERRERSGSDLDQLKAMSSTIGYQEGDPDAGHCVLSHPLQDSLARPEHLERGITSL
jgi:proline iminopeptidase